MTTTMRRTIRIQHKNSTTFLISSESLLYDFQEYIEIFHLFVLIAVYIDIFLFPFLLFMYLN